MATDLFIGSASIPTLAHCLKRYQLLFDVENYRILLNVRVEHKFNKMVIFYVRVSDSDFIYTTIYKQKHVQNK